MPNRRWIIGLLGLLMLGCRRPPSPPQPGSAADPMPPESRAWSRAAALEKIQLAESAVPAAVQLVRLAETRALCVPRELTPQLVAHLGVLALGEGHALGFKIGNAGRRLVAPVLIDADGNVSAPVAWERQEYAVLVRSDDSGVFPHLVLLPREIIVVRGGEPISAIVARALGKGRFEVVSDRRGPAVAILIELPPANPGDPPRRRIAARYVWDVAEQLFVGPGANDYPDPPGGGFDLDIDASRALLAMGGIIRGPDSQEPVPPASQPEEPSPY